MTAAEPTSGALGRRHPTRSGAKIVAVSTDAAEAFLGRVGVRGPEEIWVALAALQDTGAMIGIAVLGASAADDGRVMIAVAPERRRLRVGSDLLDALATEAEERGVESLRLSYPADAIAADALLRGSGLVTARTVVNGVVTSVLFLPSKRSNTLH